VCEEWVDSIDLTPTLLDVAGVPIPETMQGRSLIGLAAGEIADWRDDPFSEPVLRSWVCGPGGRNAAVALAPLHMQPATVYRGTDGDLGPVYDSDHRLPGGSWQGAEYALLEA